MEPLLSSAAKARELEQMAVKPAPLGALLPPKRGEPQALMEPLPWRAAKAREVDKAVMNPVPFGAPLPP